HSTVSPEQVVREMASHMSSIGFPIETIEEVKVLGKRAVAQATQTLTIPGLGYYRVWSPGAGVEIWGHVNQQIQILGLEPHFNGEARMQVRLVKRVLHAKSTILEGAFYGWANPHPGVTADGRSEEHTSELQSRENLVCRLLLE